MRVDRRALLAAAGLSASAIIGGVTSSVLSRTAGTSEVSPRWKSGGDRPRTAVLLGDSTTVVASELIGTLQNWHAKPGMHWAGARSFAYGVNGGTIEAIMTHAAYRNAVGAAPDLMVLSMGINDVRLGEQGVGALTAKLREAVNRVRADLPGADIVLHTPFSFLSTDPTNTGYMNPPSAGQKYTDILSEAYNSLRDYDPHVAVLDGHLVSGSIARTTSEIMADTIHPNNLGEVLKAYQISRHTSLRPEFRQTDADEALKLNSERPWLLYARAVENPKEFQLILGGDVHFSDPNNGVGTAFKGAGYIDLRCSDPSRIRPLDYVQQGWGAVTWQIPANANIQPRAPTVCRISGLGPQLPPADMDGGQFNVWRRL